MGGTADHPELLAALSAGISQLASTEEWQRHLNLQATFHQYSFGNTVLIAGQCPGATRVAGFRAWKALGRGVRQGEKAIRILAPMVTKRPADTDAAETSVIRGFRYVPVFDVSQTEGDPLPQPCNRLQGDEPGECFTRLVSVALAFGYSVEGTELPGGTNGDCSFTRRLIRVERRNAPAQRVKTLAHEIGHALLHEGTEDRKLAELEAESVAYLVCRHLGIDAGSYSFGYVATWAGGTDRAIAGIRASGAQIQRTAALVIDSLGPDVSRPATAVA
jgi:antirestriction protein ArdC